MENRQTLKPENSSETNQRKQTNTEGAVPKRQNNIQLSEEISRNGFVSGYFWVQKHGSARMLVGLFLRMWAVHTYILNITRILSQKSRRKARQKRRFVRKYGQRKIRKLVEFHGALLLKLMSGEIDVSEVEI